MRNYPRLLVWRPEPAPHFVPQNAFVPIRFRLLTDFSVTVHSVRSLVFCIRSASMEERRAKPLQRVFKAGTIEFDGSGVDCTIRNLSPGGATLDVASPMGIPHEITLNIASSNKRQN